MLLIDNTNDLNQFCQALKTEKFITVDTEFIREQTYRPIPCLIQIATHASKLAACIDPMAEQIDLSALLEIMEDENILKVFHSARQDIEIFYHLMHKVPKPLFDTQIGAMVCGMGNSVSYRTIVKHYLNIDLDKSSRITDWSIRPLSQKQLSYALSDVTYLADVYEAMKEELIQTQRMSWLEDEMNTLSDAELYLPKPEEAWLKIKPLSTKPQYLSILQAVCAWRENQAIIENKPRKHILRDESVLEITSLVPKTKDDLQRMRTHAKYLNKEEHMQSLLECIQNALNLTEDQMPHLKRHKQLNKHEQNLKEMLNFLLTLISNEIGVVPKIIASEEEIEKIVRKKDATEKILSGWKFEVFEQKADAFKDGQLILCFNPSSQRLEFKST